MFELQIMERGAEIGTFDFDTMPVAGGTLDLFGELVTVLNVQDAGGYWIVEIQF